MDPSTLQIPDLLGTLCNSLMMITNTSTYAETLFWLLVAMIITSSTQYSVMNIPRRNWFALNSVYLSSVYHNNKNICSLTSGNWTHFWRRAKANNPKTSEHPLEQKETQSFGWTNTTKAHIDPLSGWAWDWIPCHNKTWRRGANHLPIVLWVKQ